MGTKESGDDVKERKDGNVEKNEMNNRTRGEATCESKTEEKGEERESE